MVLFFILLLLLLFFKLLFFLLSTQNFIRHMQHKKTNRYKHRTKFDIYNYYYYHNITLIILNIILLLFNFMLLNYNDIIIHANYYVTQYYPSVH